MGDWPPDIAEEARRRGSWPIIQIMWWEDLQAMSATSAVKAALEVANANAVKDPLVAAIAEKVLAHLPQTKEQPAHIGSLFLRRFDQYAKRLGYSKAFIDRLIRQGLPTLGRHKARRVVVDQADRWITENLDHLNVDESDDIEALATRNAKMLGGAKS